MGAGRSWGRVGHGGGEERECAYEYMINERGVGQGGYVQNTDWGWR